MKQHHTPTLIAVCALALVTACAGPARRDERIAQAPLPAPTYATPTYDQQQIAQYGSVNNIEVVPLASHNNAGGAVLGAVVGAIVGNQFGSGGGKALATGAGAIGGAVAGNAIQNHNRRDDEVFRVHVRFDDGSVRNFDFQRVDDLRVGDRVKLEQGQLHRV